MQLLEICRKLIFRTLKKQLTLNGPNQNYDGFNIFVIFDLTLSAAFLILQAYRS